MKSPSDLSLAFSPLTPDRWTDLEALFAPRGARGNCWCVWWRLSRSDFEKGKGPANREGFRAVGEAGPPPGHLTDTRGRSTADAFAYIGLHSAFESEGFREAARPSPTRPMMRLALAGRDSGEAG